MAPCRTCCCPTWARPRRRGAAGAASSFRRCGAPSPVARCAGGGRRDWPWEDGEVEETWSLEFMILLKLDIHYNYIQLYIYTSYIYIISLHGFTWFDCGLICDSFWYLVKLSLSLIGRDHERGHRSALGGAAIQRQSSGVDFRLLTEHSLENRELDRQVLMSTNSCAWHTRKPRSPKPFWEAMPGSKCGKHFACLQHQSGNRGDVETWGPFSSQASTRYNQITDDYGVAPNTTERSCPIRKRRAVPRSPLSPCSKNQRDLFELRGQDGQGVLFDDFGFFATQCRPLSVQVVNRAEAQVSSFVQPMDDILIVAGWWILDAHSSGFKIDRNIWNDNRFIIVPFHSFRFSHFHLAATCWEH